MRKECLSTALFFVLFTSFISGFTQDITVESIPLKGPYLGQEPPGVTAEIFAPGIISTEASELNAVFTADGDELYFTVASGEQQTIMVICQQNGYWRERKVASFSGTFRDVDPFISPDGNQIIFSSDRAKDGSRKTNDCDFWQVRRSPSGNWLKSSRLDLPYTANKHDFYFCKTQMGAIYFSVFDSEKDGNIYWLKDKHSKPERIPSPINTDYNEHDPFIAPDESYLIFTSNRPQGFGSGDLYICFKMADSSWSMPKNMGNNINSEAYDYCAMASPDGKYIFFSSTRSGNGDIYWVDADIINRLRDN